MAARKSSSAEAGEKAKAFSAVEGGNQTLGRLDKHLAGMV